MLLAAFLLPAAMATILGLYHWWPQDTATQVRPNVLQVSDADIIAARGVVEHAEFISCRDQPGSMPDDPSTACGDLTVRLVDGPDSGRTTHVVVAEAIMDSKIAVGQEVRLLGGPGENGTEYQFADFGRAVPLGVATVIFIGVIIAIAGRRGLMSLFGLAFAALILFTFLFPGLITGENPEMIGLVGSAAVMFVVLYTTHGFNLRTSTALVGTLAGLGLATGFGAIMTNWAQLSGVSSEDDYLLAAAAPDLRLSAAVACGMIIAGLGVLNDVTITQASAVWELAESSAERRHLFRRAMRIGRDHIASTVYTIAFATVGTGLSTFLLTRIYRKPFSELIQTEAFAEEILRTLVGATCLALAVPLTTAIAVGCVRVALPARAPTP